MNSILSEDELRQKVKETVIRINIEDAMHCAPIHSMEQILAQKKTDDLHWLARLLGIKYITKLKKADLAAKIAQEISAPGNLELLFFGLDFSRWMFFLDVAEKHENIVDVALPDHYDLSQKFGLLQLFYHDGKLIFIVPDEVKAGLQALDEDDFIAFKSFSEDVIRFASAAVNLYGVLPVSILTELLEQEYKNVTVPEVLPILDHTPARNEVFCLFEQNVVHRFFEDESGKIQAESVRALLKNRSGRPRYRPPLEEFFEYADPDHTEAVDECDRLQEALDPLVADTKVMSNLIDDIAFACRVDAPIKNILSILENYNVEWEDEHQAEDVMQALIVLKNRSRSWLLFGHSPEELRNAYPKGTGSTGGRSAKPGSGGRNGNASRPAGGVLASTGGGTNSKIVPLFGQQPAESVKTGRNDPCPCGSGKKYKNCCGK